MKCHRVHRALPGFTFMEMIVVVALFSILITATSDIFMRAQRTQRKTTAQQRLQDDARYLMQKIASEFQAGSLDYGVYAHGQDCDVGQSSAIKSVDGNALLVFRRFDGTHLYIQQSNDACVDAQSTPCLALSDDGVSWSAASSKGVKIESLQFFISPDKDPFTYCEATNAYLRDVQPRVTVVVTASATTVGVKDPAHLSIQTTISSREYKR